MNRRSVLDPSDRATRRSSHRMGRSQRSRTGWTLIEMLVVIFASGTVMTLTAVSLQRLMQLSRDAVVHTTIDRTVTRLAQQLRADVHAARAVTVPDPDQLICSGTRQNVLYQWSGSQLDRRVIASAEPVDDDGGPEPLSTSPRFESYRLPGYRGRFDHSHQPRREWVTLQLTPGEGHRDATKPPLVMRAAWIPTPLPVSAASPSPNSSPSDSSSVPQQTTDPTNAAAIGEPVSALRPDNQRRQP
jgi:type II secretory pathway pseudopilin PulG